MASVSYDAVASTPDHRPRRDTASQGALHRVFVPPLINAVKAALIIGGPAVIAGIAAAAGGFGGKFRNHLLNEGCAAAERQGAGNQAGNDDLAGYLHGQVSLPPGVYR